MAFAFSFLNGQLPAHEEAVPHLCVHTYMYIYIYIIMCVHMQADVFEALDLASEFDKVGRGKFKNSQGLCHHGLYIACALKLCIDQARRCPGPRKWDGRSWIRQAVRYTGPRSSVSASSRRLCSLLQGPYG